MRFAGLFESRWGYSPQLGYAPAHMVKRVACDRNAGGARPVPTRLSARARTIPHLDHELLPENTMADAERWAAGIPGPAYAIDDETAIKAVDGIVEVISEGHWKLSTG
jgi:hypothetical protein